MDTKILLIGVGIFFVSGCSTAMPPSSVNKNQIKLVQLERRVDSNSDQINAIKFQIKEIALEVDNLEVYQDRSVVEVEKSKRPSKSVGVKKDVSALGNGNVIRVSAPVKDIQKALDNAGYYTGAIDGRVGKATKQSIKEFQRDHDLKPDGIVGKKTWAEMKNYIY